MARTKQNEPKRLGIVKPEKGERKKIRWSAKTNIKREYKKLTGKNQKLHGLLPKKTIYDATRQALETHRSEMGGQCVVSRFAGEALKASAAAVDDFCHTLFQRTAEAAAHANRDTIQTKDLYYALDNMHNDGRQGLNFCSRDVKLRSRKE